MLKYIHLTKIHTYIHSYIHTVQVYIKYCTSTYIDRYIHTFHTYIYAHITDSASLQSYLNNWLTPIVSIAAPYLNSSLLSFEVFNEPEGMTTKWGWTSCNSGTSDCAKVDIPTLQRFTNLVASTIHNVNR